jgi:ferric-dicitrate binding protein FerR (iron transport regulator)
MSPKDYSEFELEDFLLDDAFVQWARTPTPDGDAFWENWRRNHPERQWVLDEARGLVRGLGVSTDLLPVSSFRRMQAHLDGVYATLEAPRERPLQAVNRRPSRWLAWAAAAVVALVLLAAGAWYRTERPAGTAQYATGYGQTRTVTLPDGSRVLLNANSRLRTPARWAAGATREVWLEGEAFFRVTKKESTPRGTGEARFVVHTGQVDVAVLGTQFNVTNRRGQTTVTLNEGKVKLEEGALDRAVVMAPGELVRLGGDGRTLVRKKVNPGQYSSWTENRYVFDDTPLADIAQRIEDTYGVPVVLATPGLAERTFSATIPTKNLDVLLLALSEAFGMEIEKHQTKIVFK